MRAGDEGHLTAQSARPNVDSADGLCDPVVNAGIVGATTVVPGKPLKAVYVRGSVQGQPVTWLVDTGAECTLVGSAVPGVCELTPCEVRQRPVTIDGKPLLFQSLVRVDLCVGSSVIRQHPVYIVPVMKTQCLLGTDVMRSLGATISIDWASGAVTVGSTDASVNQPQVQVGAVSAPRCGRVILSRDIVIPGRHEIVVKGETSSEQLMGTCVMYAPDDAFEEKYQVVAAHVLNTMKDDRQVNIRLVNPGEGSIKLYKGTTVGHLEPVTVMQESECPDDTVVRQMTSESPRGKAELDDIIQKLIDESDLKSLEEKERTAGLLMEYRDRFPADGTLGRSGVVKHEIRTGDAPPRFMQPTRVDHSMREHLDGMVDDMLRRDVIRPSVSPYAARVVPVQKKDGSIRFCIDYRRLNADTTRDSFPLPRIDDCLDALSGAKWFHVMDLRSGYWQQELREEDRYKTAFTTHRGLFELNVTSMGLKGAPASFQRLMMVALAGLVWEICLVYLDDIIVFGRTFGESLERLELVLRALRRANLTLHPGKCSLFRKQVQFIGHVVSEEGVAPDPSKVSAVKHFPVPKSVRGVREFLGLASYFRRFIPRFADVARPLHRLLENSSRFQWTKECAASFHALKERLVSAPVLCYPNFHNTFTLTTDASDVGLGAVLTQEEHGRERVVAYASRSLTKVERRYSVTERECLALVWATRRFRVGTF